VFRLPGEVISIGFQFRRFIVSTILVPQNSYAIIKAGRKELKFRATIARAFATASRRTHNHIAMRMARGFHRSKAFIRGLGPHYDGAHDQPLPQIGNGGLSAGPLWDAKAG
jgi:hypothetical protein